MISVRYKKYYVCLILSFLLTYPVLLVKGQENISIRIDPDNARGGYSADFFDSVIYIPLETTKESLFGTIDQLEVTDNYFIILDQQTTSILFFYRNGKYKNKIKAEQPYTYFNYYSLDRADSTISVIASSASSQSILVYNFSGKLLSTMNKPEGVGGIRSLWKFKNNKVLYHIPRPVRLSGENIESYDLAYSNGYNDIVQKVKPYNGKFVNQDYNSMSNYITNVGGTESIMFSVPYEYSVLELNSKGPLRQFNFIFPQKYSLPHDFAKDSLFAGKRSRFVYQSPENYGLINQLCYNYKLGDLLFFSAISIRGHNVNFLYKLTSHDLVSFDKITGDISSSFLPVLSSRFLEHPLAIYKETIFTSVPSSILFNIKENSEYNIATDPILANYFKMSNKKDNPVVIQFRIKNSF